MQRSSCNLICFDESTLNLCIKKVMKMFFCNFFNFWNFLSISFFFGMVEPCHCIYTYWQPAEQLRVEDLKIINGSTFMKTQKSGMVSISHLLSPKGDHSWRSGLGKAYLHLLTSKYDGLCCRRFQKTDCLLTVDTTYDDLVQP